MRTWNSIKNILAGFGGQLLNVLLAFAVRTVFLYTLSKAYTGINGLFSSILTILSLSELGIGNVIIFALYKPLADNDTEKIKSLMGLYRRAYSIIGCVFFGAGLLLLPFLPALMKGTTDLVNIRVIFVLYLLDTATSYWFFAYKASILNASQKNYVVSLVTYLSTVLTAAAKILALLALRGNPTLSFYCYTLLGVLGNICKNLLIRRKADQMFPYLRDGKYTPLTREEKKPIFKNVVGMSISSVCEVMNDGIDSVVISAYLGVTTVGIFSNYVMLKSYVNQFLSTIFGSLSASLGNLCAVETTEKKESFFKTLQFAYFWAYGFCAICFWILYNPFIAGVWLDESWLLSDRDVTLLVGNFLIDGMAAAVVKYRNVNGLFWQTRYRYLFSAVFNAVLSVVLAGPAGWGISGALFATTVSLLIMISWDPVLVYREVFHKKPGRYYLSYLGYLGLAVGTGLLVKLLVLPLGAYTVGNFALKLAACLVVPNLLWFLLFRKKPEFRYLWDTAVSVAGRLLRRGRTG